MSTGLDEYLAGQLGAGVRADHISCSRDFGKPKDEAIEACALANAAVLTGRECGLRVWGVSGGGRKPAGTDFDPYAVLKKGRSFAQWVSEALGAEVAVSFVQGRVRKRRVVIMRVAVVSGGLARFRKSCWVKSNGHIIRLSPDLAEDLRAAGGGAGGTGGVGGTGGTGGPGGPGGVGGVADPGRLTELGGPADAVRPIHPNAPASWATDLQYLAQQASGAAEDGGFEPQPKVAEERIFEPQPKAAEERGLEPQPKAAREDGLEPPAFAGGAARRGAGWLGAATDELDQAYALNLLDWESLFRARLLPIPDQAEGIIDLLQRMSFLDARGQSTVITKLGALVAARDLRMFDDLDRFAIQVIAFRGTGRAEVVATQRFDTGYATAIDEACSWVHTYLRERQDDFAGASSVAPYPMAALREVVANAAAHQAPRILDGGAEGSLADALMSNLENQPSFTGPLVEVFTNRIEVSNVGSMNVPMAHIANESLRTPENPMAQTLRYFRARPSEQSGWSSVLESCDLHHAPVPVFSKSEADELELLEFARSSDIGANQMSLAELLGDDAGAGLGAGAAGRAGREAADSQASGRVRVTLRPIAPFKALTPEQRLVATYWHAFNRHSRGEFLTNGSLRERFAVEDSNSAQISRLIKDAAQHGLIRVTDPSAAPKFKRYVPYWA